MPHTRFRHNARATNAIAVIALLVLLCLLALPATAVSGATRGDEQRSVHPVVAATDTSCTSTAGTTITQCGFETPVLGDGNFSGNTVGSAWTFFDSSGISSNHSGFTDSQLAPEGVQVAFLQAQGSFTQSVGGFLASTRYTLTFSAAQRIYGGGNQDFWVLLDGALIGAFKPASTTYADLSATFVTTAGTHTVIFRGRDSAGGDNTAFIDNIRLMSAALGPQQCVTVQGQLLQPASTPTLDLVGSINGHLSFVATYGYPSQPPSTLSHLGGVVVIHTTTGDLYGAAALVIDSSGPPNNVAALIVFTGGTGQFQAAAGRIATVSNFPFTFPSSGQYQGTLCTARP